MDTFKGKPISEMCVSYDCINSIKDERAKTILSLAKEMMSE